MARSKKRKREEEIKGEKWATEQLRVYVQHEAQRHRMAQTRCMDVVLCCFFSHGSIQKNYQGVLSSKVLWYAPNLCCAVTHFVPRVLRSQEHTISTNVFYGQILHAS